MRNLIIIITIFLTNSLQLFAQTKQVNLVYGIESSIVYRSYSNRIGANLNYSTGMSLEYPFKKFSLGLGILHKSYGKTTFREFTGNEEERFNGSILYEYKRKNVRLNYIGLSGRLNYRLPCNCILLFSEYDVEYLSHKKESYKEKRDRKSPDTPYDFYNVTKLKKVNTSFSFGIGFKMHLNELLRIIMKHSYNITNNPSNQENAFFTGNYTYMRMTIGLQIGLVN